MKPSRSGRLAGVALVGALALTACGSDKNTTTGATTSPSAGGSSSSSAPAVTGTLTGEGSSAQKNAISEAISSFQEANPGATVNYASTGSGAGIKQFNAGQVDWAGSDSALKTEPKDGVVEADAAAKRCGAPAWNLPMIAGPVAVAYNLPGVDKLVLDPAVTAKIFQGTIKTWNDPAIAALNAGVTLPATAIKVFFRADESGTTENFVKYLEAAASSDWKLEASKKWPGTVGEGRQKSDGVAQGVKDTAGGVTYVEWSNAKDNNLGTAWIDNGAGPVELTGENAGKAVAAGKPAGEGNDLRLKLDYAVKEAGVYPIVLVTYEIVCSKGLSPEKTTVLKAFLKHLATPQVQKDLEEVGYAPLPAEVLTKVGTAIDAIS